MTNTNEEVAAHLLERAREANADHPIGLTKHQIKMIAELLDDREELRVFVTGVIELLYSPGGSVSCDYDRLLNKLNAVYKMAEAVFERIWIGTDTVTEE